MRIAFALLAVAACACSEQGSRDGGPLPQFTGVYRIMEIGDPEPELPDEISAFSRWSHLTRRVSRTFAGAVGRVEVGPAVGGEYSEWRVRFDDPDHEIRLLVGPRRGNDSYPVWRFEQAPAPPANEGTARVDGDELIADFAILGVEGRRPVIRERWRLTEDGRLEFSLEGGIEGGKLKRVGGFTATRR